MNKLHRYSTQLTWTGNQGQGTTNYRVYTRDHEITSLHKLGPIPGSSDPDFRGDPSRYNPEELLVASLSACHMLWYLHLCSVNDVVVIDYQDEAKGTMEEKKNGSGHFKEVTLYPKVTLRDPSKQEKALELHKEAHRFCFIANSVNFPVHHQPKIITI
ncbi:MAG: OsmC family protein [Bacteroidota bacterium]